MLLQIVLNLILTVLWMFLNGDWSFGGFFAGYIAGLLMIIVLRRFFDQPLYVRKVWACVKLLLIFLVELLKSNIAVIRHVLAPRLRMRPGIFALHTELKSDLEITLLACLITLTPGTLSLEVSEDQQTLYIHAMDIEDAAEAGADIKNSFEKAIMEVTR